MDKKIKLTEFIQNLNTIKEKIYDIKGNYIFNNSNKHKQVLVYYLYRIICKHYTFIKVNTDSSSIDVFFNNLGLQHIDKCYPISGEITNDERELDIIIDSSFELLNLLNNTIKSNKRVLGIKKDIDNFEDFMNTKFSQKIIEEDLVLLTVLLPKLNKDKLKPTYNI